MNLILIGSRIKALLIIKNIKRSYLAKELGISYNTLTKKLNGQREFSFTEITKMQKIFNLDILSFANIFFNPDFLVTSQKIK